jgi:hypothetical protein
MAKKWFQPEPEQRAGAGVTMMMCGCFPQQEDSNSTTEGVAGEFSGGNTTEGRAGEVSEND